MSINIRLYSLIKETIQSHYLKNTISGLGYVCNNILIFLCQYLILQAAYQYETNIIYSV